MITDAIKRTFTECIFLSPHLDDAVFSAGDLLLSLQEANVSCTVLTCFTTVHTDKPTLSAQAFLRQSENPSASSLFANRRDEDAHIFTRRSIAYTHLHLVDAMWRKHPRPSALARVFGAVLPEFVHLYPTYRFHVAKGKIHSGDAAPKTLHQIFTTLAKDHPHALFFAPIGTGKHTDHLIVRNAATASAIPLVYWNDYPYSLHSSPDQSFVHAHNLHPISFSFDWRRKRDFILEYQTQVSAIFHDGVPENGHETYFIPDSLKERLL